jgi:hypothetical protein
VVTVAVHVSETIVSIEINRLLQPALSPLRMLAQH